MDEGSVREVEGLGEWGEGDEGSGVIFVLYRMIHVTHFFVFYM